MQFENRILIPVSPQMHRAAQAAAADRGISLSEFVRQAISAELADDGPILVDVHFGGDDGADMPTA